MVGGMAPSYAVWARVTHATAAGTHWSGQGHLLRGVGKATHAAAAGTQWSGQGHLLRGAGKATPAILPP